MRNRSPVPPGKVPVTVTYLEMRAPPAGIDADAAAPEPALRIEAAETIPAALYRELYDTIGEEWLWGDRRGLSDQALGRIIDDPATWFLVLWRGDVPAGFAEMLIGGKEVKLVYFGLMPAFTGRGIGPWFLREFLRRAWASRPARVWLHTCSHDHPGALATYKRAGFVPFRQSEHIVDDPRAKGLIPMDAAPHVPVAGGSRSTSGAGRS